MACVVAFRFSKYEAGSVMNMRIVCGFYPSLLAKLPLQRKSSRSTGEGGGMGTEWKGEGGRKAPRYSSGLFPDVTADRPLYCVRIAVMS